MGSFIEMTAAEFRRAIGAEPAYVKEANKYKAEKTTYRGQTFDSKKEMRRWNQLKEAEKCGHISNLRRQVTYVLQDEFEYRGAKIRPITYIADFVYHDNETDSDVVEDVKSNITAKLETYRIKIKLFKHRYPELEFREYK